MEQAHSVSPTRPLSTMRSSVLNRWPHLWQTRVLARTFRAAIRRVSSTQVLPLHKGQSIDIYRSEVMIGAGCGNILPTGARCSYHPSPQPGPHGPAGIW